MHTPEELTAQNPPHWHTNSYFPRTIRDWKYSLLSPSELERRCINRDAVQKLEKVNRDTGNNCEEVQIALKVKRDRKNDSHWKLIATRCTIFRITAIQCNIIISSMITSAFHPPESTITCLFISSSMLINCKGELNYWEKNVLGTYDERFRKLIFIKNGCLRRVLSVCHFSIVRVVKRQKAWVFSFHKYVYIPS